MAGDHLEIPLLARGGAVDVVPVHRHHHHDVLVEHVPEQRRHPPVVIPPLREEELAQEAELRDRVVRRVDRLHALLPRDAHADVRRLYHRDVVGAVADRERRRKAHVVAHELHELRLLTRRAAARDDRRAAVCQP